MYVNAYEGMGAESESESVELNFNREVGQLFRSCAKQLDGI